MTLLTTQRSLLSNVVRFKSCSLSKASYNTQYTPLCYKSLSVIDNIIYILYYKTECLILKYFLLVQLLYYYLLVRSETLEYIANP